MSFSSSRAFPTWVPWRSVKALKLRKVVAISELVQRRVFHRTFAAFSPHSSDPPQPQPGGLAALLRSMKDLATDKAAGCEARDIIARGVWLRRKWERLDEEVYLAAAVSAAAGDVGAVGTLAADPQLLHQLYVWATSEAALQRSAVRCAASLAETVPSDAAPAIAGLSSTLLAGLTSSDPEVACRAAEGVAALAGHGGQAAKGLEEHLGLFEALFRMIEAPQRVAAGWVSRDPHRHFKLHAPQQRHWSGEAAGRAQEAALRALLACSRERERLLPRLRFIDALAHLKTLEAGGWAEPKRPFRGEALDLSRSIVRELAQPPAGPSNVLHVL